MRKKRGGVIRRLKKHATRATARRDQTVCETFGLDSAVHVFSKKYENARFQSIETIRTLLAELDAEFAKLGVQEYQEKLINDLIQSKTDQVVDAFDFSAETEKTLKAISARLGQALGAERS